MLCSFLPISDKKSDVHKWEIYGIMKHIIGQYKRIDCFVQKSGKKCNFRDQFRVEFTDKYVWALFSMLASAN